MGNRLSDSDSDSDVAVDIAVDTLVRTWTLLVPRCAGDQQRPNQSGDRYNQSTTGGDPPCLQNQVAPLLETLRISPIMG